MSIVIVICTIGLNKWWRVITALTLSIPLPLILHAADIFFWYLFLMLIPTDYFPLDEIGPTLTYRFHKFQSKWIAFWPRLLVNSDHFPNRQLDCSYFWTYRTYPKLKLSRFIRASCSNRESVYPFKDLLIIYLSSITNIRAYRIRK